MSQAIAHARDDAGTPILSVAQRRLGSPRKAIKVLTFMAAWDHARKQLRQETLTLDEYADWWKESTRTAFRDQALFRQAFPSEKTPDRMLDAAAAQWDERTGLAGLGNVVVA